MDTTPGSRARRRAIVMASAAALALSALAPMALAAPPENGPPGNNGTVKIHDGAGEPSPEIRNQPHVCDFHLHFFFADPEQAGTWEIQEWAPGDKGTVVLTGTYDTAGDGEDRDPETTSYELPDGHYKLFWDGDLDTDKHDKHKVFWVDCPGDTTGGGDTDDGDTDDGDTTGGGDTDDGDTTGGGGDTTGGNELPTGGTAGIGDTAGSTPPPTDTISGDPAGSSGGTWLLALLALLGVAGLALSPMPARMRARRR